MSLASFIEKYNSLVIADEGISHYQLINTFSDEVMLTFPCPADEAEIMGAISDKANELATGTYVLKLVAFGEKTRTVLGSFNSTVQGRNSDAKRVAQEHVTHAKAIAMNVSTAEGQLNSMMVRMQAADQRAHEAEERAGSLVEHVYKLGDIVNTVMYDQDERRMQREESEARIAIYKDIAGALMPLLGPLVVIASKWVENKVNAATQGPVNNHPSNVNGVNSNGSTESTTQN